MILIKNNDEICEISIENTSNSPQNLEILKLWSVMENKQYELHPTISQKTNDIIDCICDFTDIPNGEYMYTIGTQKGMLRVGDYKGDRNNTKKYEVTKEYKEYGK